MSIPSQVRKVVCTLEKIDDSICSGIEHADERTWTAFYAAFAPVMRAYAVRRGCDEPGDVVQDVFVKFVKAIRSGCFHGRSVAETCSYLKTQVARRVIDYYRRAKARCCDVTVEFDEFTVPGSYFSHRIVEAMDEASVRSRARHLLLPFLRCAVWKEVTIYSPHLKAPQVVLMVKNLPANAGDTR